MAGRSTKPDPNMSAEEFAAYVHGLLDSLSKMALRFDMPLLAHLVDLAAREAEHNAKKPGPGNGN